MCARAVFEGEEARLAKFANGNNLVYVERKHLNMLHRKDISVTNLKSYSSSSMS